MLDSCAPAARSRLLPRQPPRVTAHDADAAYASPPQLHVFLYVVLLLLASSGVLWAIRVRALLDSAPSKVLPLLVRPRRRFLRCGRAPAPCLLPCCIAPPPPATPRSPLAAPLPTCSSATCYSAPPACAANVAPATPARSSTRRSVSPPTSATTLLRLSHMRAARGRATRRALVAAPCAALLLRAGSGRLRSSVLR